MNPLKTALAATTALVASTSLSFANLIMQTANFSGSTNWGTSTSSSNFAPTQTLTLGGFNTSLGTLNSVVIVVTESASGSVNLKNTGTTSTSVSGDLINTLKFKFPNKSNVYSLGDDSTTYTDPSLAPGATSGPQTVSGTARTTKTFASNLSVFDSSWVATVGDLGQVGVSAQNGNGSASYTDTGGVVLNVSYSYTPTSVPSVPEPATLALLGTGLTGVGLMRRRKKSA